MKPIDPTNELEDQLILWLVGCQFLGGLITPEPKPQVPKSPRKGKRRPKQQIIYPSTH